MNTHNTQTCDLCGGNDFAIVSETDRHGKPLTTGLCRTCGLVCHLPVPSEEEVANYYANDYRKDYHGESKPSPRRIMRAWNNGQRICNQIRSHLQTGCSVFEIGAGIGCTVKTFETEGFDASGIEPNKGFNSYTREVLHANVANTNLYDLEGKADRDVILLIHVIEHFSSPTRALTHIHSLLNDGGLFYVECPNLAAPFATFDRLFHYAHIYNFTPATLIALARKCGFELVEQYSDASNPDIHMLFRKTGQGELAVDPAEADRTKAAVHRYNTLTYHLRPGYLGRRVRKVSSYLQEFLLARLFLKGLLAINNKQNKD